MKVINFAFGLLMLVLTHSLRGGLPSSGFDTHVCGIVHGGSQSKLRHENIKKIVRFFFRQVSPCFRLPHLSTGVQHLLMRTVGASDFCLFVS